MAAALADVEIRCPACGRYLGTVDGTRLRCAPCTCGVQTTVEIVGKRARRLAIETPAGPLEVKRI